MKVLCRRHVYHWGMAASPRVHSFTSVSPQTQTSPSACTVHTVAAHIFEEVSGRKPRQTQHPCRLPAERISVAFSDGTCFMGQQ